MLKLGQILTISLALLGNGLPETSVTSQDELAPYVLSVPVIPEQPHWHRVLGRANGSECSSCSCCVPF
jgi:hypothetical protein